jgi:hypothetical protein
MGSAQVSGEKCGMTCIKTNGCTHFAWNNYNGGTCWMKKSSSIQKSSAVFNGDYSMVCGILPVINWQPGEGGVSWALGCDFVNNEMGSAQVSGEKCGMTCIKTNGCTHFAWNNFNGGTCWMKKSSSIQKSNAIFNGDYNRVCGILPASQPSSTLKPVNLVWSDEFDYSGAPDPAKWTVVNAGGGFGNNEAQFYTPQNVNVSGGYLTIQARKQPWGGHQYTSGKLTTKTHFTYGIFEMRAKIPQGRGTWAAFWLLNPNNWPLNGEIDIMGNY